MGRRKKRCNQEFQLQVLPRPHYNLGPILPCHRVSPSYTRPLEAVEVMQTRPTTTTIPARILPPCIILTDNNMEKGR